MSENNSGFNSFDSLAQGVYEANQQKIDERKKEKKTYDFDSLSVYFGKDYQLTPHITIHQPSILEISRMGEEKYWNMVIQLCGNTTSFRVPLWNMGIDWTKISDFELFAMLCPSLDMEMTKILFGPIDFTKFIKVDLDEGRFCLVNLEHPEITIDEETYKRMVEFLRIMFSHHPKEQRAKMGKKTKQSLINIDLQEIQRREQEKLEGKDDGASMLSLISYALNSSGFKYKKDELENVGIYEFMDSIKRLENTESTKAMLGGIYSGMVDTSKIPDLDKKLDFTRGL